MKKLTFVTALLILSASGFAADTGDRHVEKAGGFSFCPPKSWDMKEIPGVKYKIAFGPASDGFAPNINVVDESFARSLSDYVKGNQETLTKMFKGFKNLGQSEFKTDSGSKGVKLITQSEQQGQKLRQTFFFFDGKGGKKLVATCSALAENGAKLDETFAASMKTFTLEK